MEIQVNKIADLTLFDPKTVAPRATYKNGENGLPPKGIPYVIVNGTIVVKDSEVLSGRDVRLGLSRRRTNSSKRCPTLASKRWPIGRFAYLLGWHPSLRFQKMFLVESKA